MANCLTVRLDEMSPPQRGQVVEVRLADVESNLPDVQGLTISAHPALASAIPDWAGLSVDDVVGNGFVLLVDGETWASRARGLRFAKVASGQAPGGHEFPNVLIGGICEGPRRSLVVAPAAVSDSRRHMFFFRVPQTDELAVASVELTRSRRQIGRAHV